MIEPDTSRRYLEQISSFSAQSPSGDEDVPLLRMVSELAGYDRTIREIADLVLSYARNIVPCEGAALYGITRSANRLASLGSDRLDRSLIFEGREAARKAVRAVDTVSIFDGPADGTFACAPIRSSSRSLGCYLTYWAPTRKIGPGEMRNIEMIACIAHIAAHHYRAMELHGRVVSHLMKKDRHIRDLARLARIGQGTAEMVHEIANAVTTITGWAEIFRMAEDPDEMRVYAQKLSASARVFGDRVRRMLGFSKGEKCRSECVDLKGLVRGLMEDMGGTFRRRNISTIYSSPRRNIEIWTQRPRLEQILRNVLVNACDAVKEMRTREISITLNKKKKIAVVEVEDSGRGIPAGMEDRIFEPFVTTKPNGTGLGLSISRKIAHELGGRLRVENGDGNGARFVLELPLAQPCPGESRSGDGGSTSEEPCREAFKN